MLRRYRSQTCGIYREHSDRSCGDGVRVEDEEKTHRGRRGEWDKALGVVGGGERGCLRD